MLNVHKLTGGYSSAAIIKDVSFELEKGELLGIIGPNGSGKTTLIKMLTGILPYESGEIVLKGKCVKDYTAKELAKILAVLPQHSFHSFPYTVKETVSLGRYAHQKGWFQSWSERDESIVNEAMDQTGVISFADHYVHELSGGERQRVYLAQALAQEPEILLLDEPTNHLDLSFQKELLDLLRGWTRERNLTVISIFHDLNLAGLYCDRLLLLESGEVQIDHLPNEVLKEDRIRKVYRTDIQKQPHPIVPAPQIVLLPDHASDEPSAFINEDLLEQSDQHIVLKSPIPLRTMSSGVVGSGTGWYQVFVNRHVSKDYNCDDHKQEMTAYLKKNGFEPSDAVGMMTAVVLDDVSFKYVEQGDFSVFVVVTAGVGNAVDASKGTEHCFHPLPGTINTWVFVNGDLAEEAFIQSIMTATEAKAKAMLDLKIIDPVTGTIATGTSTDSILIAASQRGQRHDFAGTITPLGKVIGQTVYSCTAEAVRKSRKRVKK